MKPVSEVAAAAVRGRVARVRQLLWHGVGGGGQSAEMSTARAIGRASLFTLLSVSLVGTLMTTIYLPGPWGRLVVVPAALGALCAGFAAFLHAFLASFAVVEAAHRRASAAGTAVKRRVARREGGRTPVAPK